MFKFRSLMTVALCGTLTLGSAPNQADACCWLRNWCRRPQATYLPAAPACGPCQQQVNYVPQTCYRTVYTNVPVTTLRPVTTTDPCTGCPVTAMRPCTTMVQRPQVVPFTTYRPVYTTVAAAPACSSCGPAAASYYQPSTAVAPSSGCCGTGAPPVTYSSPAVTSPPILTPPPTTLGPPSGTYTLPQTTTPSLPQSDSGFAPQTFQPQGSSYRPDSILRPAPNYDYDSGSRNPSSSAAPRLLDPSNRTTAKPMPGSWAIRPAVLSTSDTASSAEASFESPVDDSGWHAARR